MAQLRSQRELRTLYRSQRDLAAAWRAAHYYGFEELRTWIDMTSFSEPREVPSIGEEEPVSYFEWGAASNFETGETFRERSGRLGFNDHEPGEIVPDVAYSEKEREFELEGFINPDNIHQYVDVARPFASRWGSPDGGFDFVFKGFGG